MIKEITIYLFFCLILFLYNIGNIDAQSTSFGELNVILDNSIESSASDIYLSDLNGDGHKDILTNELAWYPNNGDGTFGLLKPISNQSGYDILTADIDGDGDEDAICTSPSSGFSQIRCYRNNGDGNFGLLEGITSELNFQLVDIDVADLDGDGDVDILYSLNGSSLNNWGEIGWLENDGSGVFGSKIVINDSLWLANDVSSGDLDNDGDLDVISTNNSRIMWYENNGNTVFSDPIIINSNLGTNKLLTVDLDEDNDLDIICLGFGEDRVIWHRNIGNGNFSSEITIPHNIDGPREINIIDLDGDLDLDLIVTSWYTKEMVWLENDGNTNFVNANFIANNINPSSNILVEDLDGNGIKDVVSLSSDESGIKWFNEDGFGNYVEEELFNWQIVPTDNQVAIDWDGDNDEDLWVWDNDFIYFVENDGLGNFTFNIPGMEIDCDISKIFPKDIDTDGDMDFAVLCSSSMLWYKNEGNGVFVKYTIDSSISSPKAFYIEDMDADGDYDIICGSNELTLYKNNGSQNFGTPIVIEDYSFSPTSFVAVYPGDIDGTGPKDIVTVGNNGDVFWFKNWGNNYFGSVRREIIDITPAGEFLDIQLADIDADEDLDILLVACCTNKSGWLLNDGLGGFGDIHQYEIPTYSLIYKMQAVDIDHDGDLDILGSGGYGLTWAENIDNLSFSEPKSITNTHMESISIADFDGDNILDISFGSKPFISGQYIRTIGWMRNLIPYTIVVDQNAQGNNDGSSWDNAFVDLQDALAIAQDGDYIYIAEGTYIPTVDDIRGISFDIPSGVTIIGGYSTGGTDQDPSLYPTILSGNINNSSNITDDSYHVMTIKDAADVSLKDLIIRDGNADDSSSFSRSRGGGIYIKNSIVSLDNVEIKWNRAVLGGGLFATISSDVEITNSIFKQNRAENGAAIYHSNESTLLMDYSRVTNNVAYGRCAIEVNNSLYTKIENTLIADNISSNANAIAFIATNRDQSADIISSTILGESQNKNLISIQVGNNDQMDLNMHHTIVAHQNPAFNKNIVAYNFGTLNFNHHHCYFQGSSVIGNGSNNLFSGIDGNLVLNSDYSPDICTSVVVNAGNNGSFSYGTGLTDLNGNYRFRNEIIDIGAFEFQMNCPQLRLSNNEPNIINEIEEEQPLISTKENYEIAPNPTSGTFVIQFNLEQNSILEFRIHDLLGRLVFQQKESFIEGEQRKNLDIANLNDGIYLLTISNGNHVETYKIIKSNNGMTGVRK